MEKRLKLRAALSHGGKHAKFAIKVGDNVLVITGKCRGKTGVVKLVCRKTATVIVSGINIVKKTIKRTESSEDNFAMIEKPIHISNIKKVESI